MEAKAGLEDGFVTEATHLVGYESVKKGSQCRLILKRISSLRSATTPAWRSRLAVLMSSDAYLDDAKRAYDSGMMLMLSICIAGLRS